MKTISVKTRVVRRPATPASWQALYALTGRWAAVLFLGAVLLVGAIQPGYDALADPISHLGASEAPYAGWFNASMAVSGVLVAFFALGLHQALGPAAYGWWPPFLIGVFGVAGLSGSALLTCDVGCDGASVVGQLHYVPAVLGGVALIWGLALMPARLRESGWLAGAAFGSQLVAHLCLLGLLSFDLAASGAMPRWQAYVGLAQKVVFGVVFGWMFWVGRKIVRRE